MKIKKIHIARPKVTVELERPIISMFYLITIIPKMFIVKKAKINIYISSKILKNAGHVKVKNVWVVIVPRLKVKKGWKIDVK